MTRIMAPDRGAIEMEVGGTRYHQPFGGGAVVVENREHERIMLAGGCFRAALNPYTRRSTHQCPCGARLWRRLPGNHGRQCLRCDRMEGDTDAHPDES